MKTIYKYPVPIEDYVTIALPMNAQVLTVQTQSPNEAQLWALVDNEDPVQPRRFRLVGTGHPFEDADKWHYVSTFQMYGGGIVFHVFEEATK